MRRKPTKPPTRPNVDACKSCQYYDQVLLDRVLDKYAGQWKKCRRLLGDEAPLTESLARHYEHHRQACRTCDETKSLRRYHRHIKSKTGFDSECASCASAKKRDSRRQMKAEPEEDVCSPGEFLSTDPQAINARLGQIAKELNEWRRHHDIARPRTDRLGADRRH